MKTRIVKVGSIAMGGGNPVTVQSMTNTDTRDIKATINQIHQLSEAGCEIIRVAVPDMEAAVAVGSIKKAIKLPLVADIHFDHRLALTCIEQGVDKIRINPGNIGSIENVKKVVDSARIRNIPIRIGVNAGSLEKYLLEKYGGPSAEAMVESAITHAKILENLDFGDVVISLKASSVTRTIEAYKLMASKYDYPLHVGVTEAGTVRSGTIKSSVGIGSLLTQGIGDTIRVSLTGHPVEEVYTGIEILKSLELRKTGVELISCPTCGRCNVALIGVAEQVEKRLSELSTTFSDKQIKIAVMGCAVNGPGEAREADIGIAGGVGEFLLFKKGEAVRKISEQNAVEELLEEIKQMISEE